LEREIGEKGIGKKGQEKGFGRMVGIGNGSEKRLESRME
jgi:hypothetical protein